MAWLNVAAVTVVTGRLIQRHVFDGKNNRISHYAAHISLLRSPSLPYAVVYPMYLHFISYIYFKKSIDLISH